jgi:diguanylate cyclase (GGDEF)-like protein
MTPQIIPTFPGQNQDGTVVGLAPATQSTPIIAIPYLVVLFPIETQHRRFQLGKTPQVIGRSQGVEIELFDEQISRKHCEIAWDGLSIIVRDAGSTNGTFVDGSRLAPGQPVILAPDNRLQIGSFVLKVEYKDPGEIERENALFEAATTDALTRIPNRRFFLERARSEWAASKRSSRFVHTILLDVDFFKKVNDTYGHPAGDFVLREVAAQLNKVRREEDLLARWGGEEFIFLLAGIEPSQALAFAERARKAIEFHRIVWEDTHIPVTVSLGLASSQGAAQNELDHLIAQADSKLYQAKRNGRNRVET